MVNQAVVFGLKRDIVFLNDASPTFLFSFTYSTPAVVPPSVPSFTFVFNLVMTDTYIHFIDPLFSCTGRIKWLIHANLSLLGI